MAARRRRPSRRNEQELRMIDDFQHVSITCRDLEHSVRFYEKLGLKVINHIGEVKTDGIAQAFRLATGSVRVVYLAPPNASSRMFIDLVQWLEPPSTGEPYHCLEPCGNQSPRISSIRFRCDNSSSAEPGHHVSKPRGQAFGEGIRSAD